MEAIILAGGMGTRLSKVVTDVPKPMAPVNGKPFLFYLLQWIKKYPIEKIILSIGYKSESIVNYFGKSFNDIPFTYVIEEKPLGTGGALKFALKKTKGKNILALNGDSYFPIDLNKFILEHSENNHLFSVALKRMKDFSRYGSVECLGNTIIKFNEKKFYHDGLINGGIYLINRQFIESKQLPAVFSLEKEILEKEVQTSELKCKIFDDVFIDIGIPEDYLRAESILK
jgi:D-glycero-alpha-D-manno-heptose 1-phosphate guanylyltransferase